jgi:hypothetical protein
MSFNVPDFFSSVGRSIWKNLVDLVNVFLKTLIVWVTLVGLICLFFVIWPKGVLAHEPYPKLLELLATVLLTGGVFEVLMKSMQYSGVFKDELIKLFDDKEFVEKQEKRVREILVNDESRDWLEKVLASVPVLDKQKAMLNEVISSVELLNSQKNMISEIIYDQRFLKNRKDLEEVWKRVSTVVYNDNFPEISDRIVNRVLKEYFPRDDNFYYDRFTEEMDITSHPDNKHICVKSTLAFTIKAMNTSEKVTWDYKNEIRKDPADTVTSYELTQLTVNDDDKRRESGLTVQPTPDGAMLRIAFSLALENENAYTVRIVENKIYDLAVDDIKDFTSKRFVNTLRLNVTFPNDLDVRHSPVGVGSGGKLQRTNANSLSYVYKDLIFPNQGYRLVLRRR